MRTALIVCLLSLTACNPPQPLNFSVQNVQASPGIVDADLKGVTVTPAAPNERTGDLPPAVAGVTTTWKTATEEALGRAAIFNDDSRRHVNLEVKVLKFSAPPIGVTFPTNTEARYTLIDRANGGVIFSQVIAARGTTPGDFAFVGAIRARESVNRAAQNNIAAFIDALERSPLRGGAHPAPYDIAAAHIVPLDWGPTARLKPPVLRGGGGRVPLGGSGGHCEIATCSLGFNSELRVRAHAFLRRAQQSHPPARGGPHRCSSELAHARAHRPRFQQAISSGTHQRRK